MSRNLLPRPAAHRNIRLAALWTCSCAAIIAAAAIPAATSAPSTVVEAAAPPAIAVEAPNSPAPHPVAPAAPAPSPSSEPAAEPETEEPETEAAPAPEPKRAEEPSPAPRREEEPASRDSVRIVAGSPKAYAAQLVDPDQLACLVPLWDHESGWNPNAVNRSSGAYGIPQALSHGHPYDLGDYQAQIEWGLNYISTTYGSPCRAWSFWQAHHWY